MIDLKPGDCTDVYIRMWCNPRTYAIDRVPRLKDNPAILELLFNRVDQNDDGKLTPDEFEELRQQIRNGR